MSLIHSEVDQSARQRLKRLRSRLPKEYVIRPCKCQMSDFFLEAILRAIIHQKILLFFNLIELERVHELSQKCVIFELISCRLFFEKPSNSISFMNFKYFKGIGSKCAYDLFML